MKYGAILADPPWHFATWIKSGTQNAQSLKTSGRREAPYPTMSFDEIAALPVAEMAAIDCMLFLWVCWPVLLRAAEIITKWGFTYKTCGFCWIKAHAQQVEMFKSEIPDQMGLGYWTRANSEVCLLATRGHPKRLAADVRQAIIEPRREHSRKPDCVHKRIERLVAGPYLELFARQRRPGWDCWGNECDKFRGASNDITRSNHTPDL
jgi:N6-adenosine-specific RNA methylase IME4